MTDIIITTVLTGVAVAGFILSGYIKKKGIGIWDIAFIGAFWNLFDTGWWFHFDWAQQSEPDLLSAAYMISSILFTIVFLAYIKRREIGLGLMTQTLPVALPKFPARPGEYGVLLAFTGTAVLIVLPIAFAMGFIAWSPDMRFSRMPIRFLEYFIFVGFVEELVFRGAIQNLLINTFKFRHGRITGLLVANILFAFMWTHSGVPAPINWDYIIMAFILGLFYTGVYVKSGNLWTAAFLHGLTDFIWVTFFTGQG